MSTRCAKITVKDLWLRALFFAMLCVIGVQGAHSEPTPGLRIVVDGSPDPTIVNVSTSVKISAYFYDKTTQQEIYPPGVDISWSCPWTQKEGATQNTNTSNIGFSPPTTAANVKTTMTATFDAVGKYTVRVRASASKSSWTPDTSVSVATDVTVDVQDAIVTLDVGKTKTGYWANNEKDIFQVGTITIRPASALSDVTYGLKPDTSAQNDDFDQNVSFTEKSRTAGKITFEWRGTSGSRAGAGKESGSTIIEARYNGVVKDSKRVVVVVPKSVKKPDERSKSYFVTGKNDARNKMTTPPDYNTDIPHRTLGTYYTVPLTINVLDQFGNALDDLYEGANVSEYFVNDPTRNTQPINQKLNGSGAYIDPVGKNPPNATGHYWVEDDTTSEGQVEINKWISGVYGVSPLEDTGTPNIEPKDTLTAIVAGFPLSPQIVRLVSFKPKDGAAYATEGTLTITWVSP